MKLFKRKNRDFTITRPTDAEFNACADIIAKAVGQQAITKKALEQTLKAPGFIVLVAKSNDRIVGLITGLAVPSTIPPPRIDFLSVPDQASAQKGLYGILIDNFIDELKKRVPTAKHVDTNVGTANPNFIAMYSLKGFRVIGFIRGESPQSDIAVLRKDLSTNKASHYTV